MKLVVFTICKDEAETIKELIKRIPKKIKGVKKVEIVVITDGGTDATAKLARKHGATLVIEGLKQKRLAYRFQQAVDVVLERKADIAVNIDGDLQFKPEDIPRLIKPILDGKADFVAADRFTDPISGLRKRPKHMPVGKYWANRMGAWIVGNLSGQEFRDVTCGFRAYNKNALMAININSGYTYTQESFQVLAIKKMDIVSVPVEVTYYPGRKSRVVKSFWQFLFGSALNILRAYRDYAPLRFFGTLSLLTLVPGIGLSIFVTIHWTTKGMISPYISLGIIGLFLVLVGTSLGILGLLADMLDRILNNQDKIINTLKKNSYAKK